MDYQTIMLIQHLSVNVPGASVMCVISADYIVTKLLQVAGLQKMNIYNQRKKWKEPLYAKCITG